MPRNDDPVEVNCVLLYNNERSLKIEDADGREISLPKTYCEMDPPDADENDSVTITMPEWLAVDRGLV